MNNALKFSAKILLLMAVISSSYTIRADGLQARGLIRTLDNTTLSSELTSRVISLPKRMGESFKQGDVLAELDCRLFEAQRQKVSAELKSVKLKLGNARKLSDLRSIGTLELALAESEVQKTRAEFDIATLNTDRCHITAPYDGRIEHVLVQEYETVQQNQEMLKIVGNQRLEAEIVVPADWLKWIASGQPVLLQSSETGQLLSAQVSYISPAIDPTSQTLQLRARLPDQTTESIYPGMSVLATFHPTGLSVPASDPNQQLLTNGNGQMEYTE